MNFEKFTTKAAEAIQSANQLAVQQQNSQIDVLHLFLAMLEQSDGYIPSILGQLEINKEKIRAFLISEISKLPKLQGDYQMGASSELTRVLTG
ncbi:MAG TPA: Clp protease N-terminal domain-containing protein, partial [Candidatus Absconditabacterales bacterium]|nr:Clp protease N-terminal domain-containing protein [Candidatus Absconditabacterales bacterium]